MTKRRVLFLCTGNSARSQMAEGFVNALRGEQWEALSAGVTPSGEVHPLAIRAMAEVDIDISDHESKHLNLFRNAELDLVVTVCDNAAKSCPLWLGRGEVVHMAFPDPAAATGSEEERLDAFRRVRDSIRERILPHLDEVSE
jgi:arsenate reductase